MLKLVRAYGVCNQRLKLKYDEPLSNFAYNFNLRPYSLEHDRGAHPGGAVQVACVKPSFLELNATRLITLDRANDVSSHGRAVQVDSIQPRVETLKRQWCLQTALEATM